MVDVSKGVFRGWGFRFGLWGGREKMVFGVALWLLEWIFLFMVVYHLVPKKNIFFFVMIQYETRSYWCFYVCRKCFIFEFQYGAFKIVKQWIKKLIDSDISNVFISEYFLYSNMKNIFYSIDEFRLEKLFLNTLYENFYIGKPNMRLLMLPKTLQQMTQ